MTSILADYKVTLIEADLFTANIVTDTLKEDTEFPVFVLIPVMPTENERVSTGMVSKRIQVFGFLLFSNKNSSTSDFVFSELRPTVEAAKTIVDKVVNVMYKSPITNKSKDGILKYNCTETYAKFDAHLFGCQVDFAWDVIVNVPC